MPSSSKISLLANFQGLRINHLLSSSSSARLPAGLFFVAPSPRLLLHTKHCFNFSAGTTRSFSSTTARRNGTWLDPKLDRRNKQQKGRARVATGGSVRGTTVVNGEWGLRMVDYHRRISSKHLRDAAEAIKTRLRGQKFKMYPRVTCNIGVFVSGNEVRMGKGKGSFDHWATRVAVNQIVLELRGLIHEQVARDALRLAGNKLPGVYAFVKRGDPPFVGMTKLKDGLTLEMLKKPRKAVLATSQSKAQEVSASTATLSSPPPS